MAEALSLFHARARVLGAVRPVSRVERVPLAAADGRWLAEAIVLDADWPATDRSAMDGFALVAGAGLPAGTELPVVGESLAGKPFRARLEEGQAVRIMTGSVVPEGADTVVPVESTGGFVGSTVLLNERVVAGANVRRAGSERRAGERVLPVGSRIGPAQIGALAVLGRTFVDVAARPRVAILATGDEVVPVEAVPAPHQVRESNSWALAAQVSACGGAPERLGIAPDEPAALRDLIAQGLDRADVLLTIGGVSQGTHDLVHGTLRELGVVGEFHGIQLKPGKPTFFGHRTTEERRCHVFGLPGNPASTFTVFDLLVRPLLTRWLGGDAGQWSLRVPLGEGSWRPNSRLQAVRARLRAAPGGGLVVDLGKVSPSGDPFALLDGDGYVLVPPGVGPTPALLLEFVGGASGIELP